MGTKFNFCLGLFAGVAALAPSWAQAGVFGASPPSCPVTYAQLKSALTGADAVDMSGFNNHFWGVVVNREGVICAVAYSGANPGAQWLGSRQIAAAKAFTANAFSLPMNGGTGTTALSTAQLYQFVQPSNPNVGNPLFGLEGGNSLDGTLAYLGDFNSFGSTSDPLIGLRIGGTITFGGGLALYSGDAVVGGLGLSGDTACADHSTAWRTRNRLALAPAGLPDKLPFANDANMTAGHPHCPNDTRTQGATGNTTAGD